MWIKSQFIIILENEDGEPFKTYHIFCSNNIDLLFLFLHKNSDIIEAEGVIPKFKIIYSDYDSQYIHIKSKLKDNLVLEIKKDYFVIDFEKFPELESQYFDHLREENFDDLNDYFFYNHVARQDKRSVDPMHLKTKKMMPPFTKGVNKFSLSSEENDGVDQSDLTIIEIALLGTDAQIK